MLGQLNFHLIFAGSDRLLSGLVATLQLSAIVIAIATFTGFIVAILAMSPLRVVRVPVRAYIELFRCTPALIQIVWFFYCVPVLFNVFWEPFTMAVMALTLNLTAYNAEAYRAAIQSIPKLHSDASVALGLNRWHYYRYVVFPQALRLAVPVLVTNSIGMIQQSALVALVAVEDLMYEAKSIASSTYRPVETYTTVALIYFAVSFALSRIVERIQARNNRLMER
jgi:polar amino acid transport system permease protein